MVAIILSLRTELFPTIKWIAYEKYYQSFHLKNILLLLLSYYGVQKQWYSCGNIFFRALDQ